MKPAKKTPIKASKSTKIVKTPSAAKISKSLAARRSLASPDAPEDIRDAVTRLKRERIVAAAVELFYHQGYTHTTLEQVADAIQVTKPFIYSHFKSKSDLLVLTHQAHAVIYSREEKELKPEDREEINKMRRVFDHKLVALMEEGIAAKEFVVEDVHLTALAIVGIVGWSQVWFRPGGRLTTAEAAQRVSTLVLAMVQAKKLPKP